MVNKELSDFIKESMKAGLGPIQIRNKLLEAGWQEKDIDEALNQDNSPTASNYSEPLKTTLTPEFNSSLAKKANSQKNLNLQTDAPAPTAEQTPSRPINNPLPPQSNSPDSQVSISIEKISDPSRFYVIPIIGPLIKLIILIPIFIEAFILCLYWLVLIAINCLIILFSGQYWSVAYDFNVKFLQWQTKITFFLFGLTNKYPGFGLAIDDNYSISIPQAASPSRMFAIPLLGMITRYILIYPFMMFNSFLQLPSMYFFFLIAWVPILFKKSYPQSLFEIVRDAQTLSLRANVFLMGINDDYPDFHISWNLRNKKYLIIVLPIILMYLFYSIGILGSLGSISSYDSYSNKYDQPNTLNLNLENTLPK